MFVSSFLRKRFGKTLRPIPLLSESAVRLKDPWFEASIHPAIGFLKVNLARPRRGHKKKLFMGRIQIVTEL